MSDSHLNVPQRFRQEATQCFRLAEVCTDQKASGALMNSGRELLIRAWRLETALAAASAFADPPVRRK